MPVESNHTWGWPYGRCDSSGYGLPDNIKNVCMLKFPSCNNVYKGTTFAGYVGLMTGMKPNKFTMSLDQQNKHDWQENASEIICIYIHVQTQFKHSHSLKCRHFIVYSSSLTTHAMKALHYNLAIHIIYIVYNYIHGGREVVVAPGPDQWFSYGGGLPQIP